MTLYEKLRQLNSSDMYPLHMPGHKRNPASGKMAGFYGIDITEIDGFDDLHAPEGIIRDMEDRLAACYGADRAFISVNGSTAANEAAILSACRKNDKVLLARNCHKSVYYAIELIGAEPVYIVPDLIENTAILAPLTAGQIEKALIENPGCREVIISSPTYDGITADVAEIAGITHKYDAVLIVDCAHGAHLGFCDELPESPTRLGADLVIMSLHKMLPAPTQTAVLFTCSERVDQVKVEHYMNVFQSSSPSYILMAGVGECIKYLENDMAKDIKALSARCDRLRANLKGLKNISIEVPGCKEQYCADKCKLIIASTCPGVNGRRLYDILREKYHIQCEMCGPDYALGLLTVMDDDEGFARIEKTLRELDLFLDTLRQAGGECSAVKNDIGMAGEDICDLMKLSLPECLLKIHEAFEAEKVHVNINEAGGRTAAAYVTVYPPGMPILVPGEKIDQKIISYINRGVDLGLNIQGLAEDRIPVVI